MPGCPTIFLFPFIFRKRKIFLCGAGKIGRRWSESDSSVSWWRICQYESVLWWRQKQTGTISAIPAPMPRKTGPKPRQRLKQELLEQLTFAFRNAPDLFRVLKDIRTGGGHAEMLQGLNDLSVLGRGHPDLLSEINFDMALLDEAAEASSLFSGLMAQAGSDRDLIEDSKVIRNQAYLHLKESVDAIRSFGKFAFRHDNARQKGYFSFYLQQKRARRVKKAEGSAVDGTPSTPGSE